MRVTSLHDGAVRLALFPFLYSQGTPPRSSLAFGCFVTDFGSQCLLIGREKGDNKCLSNYVSVSLKVGVFSPLLKSRKLKFSEL